MRLLANRSFRRSHKKPSDEVKRARAFRRAKEPSDYRARVALTKIKRLRRAGMTEAELRLHFPTVVAIVEGKYL